MRKLSRRLKRHCQPSNGVLGLAACLLALDHNWSELTLGGLSLFAGVMLVRAAGNRAGPGSTEVRCAPCSSTPRSVSRCD